MDHAPSTPRPGGNALRLALAALMLLAVAAFFALDLDQRLTLASLKASALTLRQWAELRPLASAAWFFALYAAITALGLPGAAVMTIASGALFSFAQAVLLSSFASTLGAVLSCLAARYILRGFIQARFGARLTAVNAGIEREGVFYLVSIRLIPALPFFLINLLLGLTPMPVRTFAWASQLGMFPGTLVFVYAGTQLARVDSLADVLSPGLLAAFAGLGLFPLAARWLVSYIRRRRAA